MNTGAFIATVAVIVVLAVAAVLVARPLLRRRRLQERFGAEYDRAVDSHDNRSDAERELMEREKRHQQLELRPLAPEARERYAAQWTEVQARFVDSPERAVADADRLVTELMADRGYPTEDHEQRIADLSVEHSSAIDHYRAAHDIRRGMGEGDGSGGASTEDLRAAMVHYRVLFRDLLEPDAAMPDTSTDRPADRLAAGDVADPRTTDARTTDGRTVDGRPDAGFTDARTADGQAPPADAEIADAERGRTGRHQATR